MPTNIKKNLLTSFINKNNFVESNEIIESKNNSYSMPISIENLDTNFSFKQKLNIDLLENSNIMDSSIKENKNSNLKIDSKFDSESDPIYDLDEEIDIVYENKNYKKNVKEKILLNKLKNKKSKSSLRY